MSRDVLCAVPNFLHTGKSGVWKDVLSRGEAEKVHQLLEQVNQAGLTFDD